MLLASAIACAILRQVEPPPIVETFKWLGKSVEVRLPLGVGEEPSGGPKIEFKGWRYGLGADGLPASRCFDAGGWRAVGSLYATAKARWTGDTPTYHVAVFLVTRTDIVERTAAGLRRRRNTIRGRELDSDLQQIGMFIVAANAAARGEYKVVADLSLDEDPVLVNADAKNPRPLNSAWARGLVMSRTNDGGYEPDDKAFRGPYQSVFVLHSGLQGFDGERFATRTNSGAVLSCVGPTGVAAPDGLARLMLQHETRNLADLVTGMVDPGPIGSIRSLNANVDAAAGWSGFVSARLQGKSFDETADGSCLREAGNSDAISIALQDRSARKFEPNGSIWRSESDPDVVGVPATMLELFRSKWASAKQLELQSIDGVPVVALQLGGEGVNPRVFGSTVSGDGGPPAPEPAEITSLNYSVKRVADPGAPAFATISETGSVRSGFAAIKGMFSGSTTGRFLEFKVRSKSRDPIAVSLLGVPKGPYALGPGQDRSIGQDQADPAVGLQCPNDGTWQTVRIDLGEQITCSGTVLVRPTETSLWWERVEFEPIQYDLADFKLSDQAGDAPTPLGSVQSDEDRRLLQAQTANPAALERMLADRSDLVVMNVLARLSELKVPATCEPALVKFANSIDPKISEYAIRCLVRLGSETSKPFARGLIEKGLFPHVRSAAASIAAESKDPLLVGPISTLFASRSWHARISALDALSKLSSPELPVVVTTFLNIEEPEVRVRATSLADVRNETVCRRLFWTSVNDVSDEVRSLAYLRLIDSREIKYRAEGYKGMRDDSPGVRARVIRGVRTKGGSLDEVRSLLRLAVTDPVADVREAALEAFAGLQGSVELSDLGNASNDKSSRVRLAFIDVVVAKKVQLPAALVSELQTSPNARIRESAKRLTAAN